MSRIPDEIAIRAFRVIDVVEQQLADAQEDKKQAYSDLREELKAAGFKGEEISKEVADFKAGLAQHRRSEADRAKADEREEGAAYYLGIFNSPRARARTREGQQVPAGSSMVSARPTQHQSGETTGAAPTKARADANTGGENVAAPDVSIASAEIIDDGKSRDGGLASISAVESGARDSLSSPVNDSGQGEADGAFRPGNHTSVSSAPISHGQPSELAG